jgi:colicin import membrane protein
MNWVATPQSKQFSEVGFAPETSTLGIRFKARGGGKVAASEYHYDGVEEQVHDAMLGSSDIDGFFNKVIKANPEEYPYRKIVEGEVGEVLPPAQASDSALAKVDKMTPEQIFVPGAMDVILEQIRAEVIRQAEGLDISTEQNRKTLASLAFKVTKSKTFIESQRKILVTAEKKRLSAIDAEGRRIWDILEGIAAEVRKPLTEFEQKDKDRIAKHEQGIADLLELAKVPFGSTAAAIKGLIAKVEAIDTSKFDEYASIAGGHKSKAIDELTAALNVTEEVERQKAENERLKAEAAERAQRDAIDAAVREAQEQAAVDAEVERQRLEKATQEAEARATAAEAARIAAEEEADRRAAAAAEQAQRDAEAAVESERRRIAEAERLENEAQTKREANKKHVKAVNAEAVNAIRGFLVNRDPDEAAKEVLGAIITGLIPHVTITY